MRNKSPRVGREGKSGIRDRRETSRVEQQQEEKSGAGPGEIFRVGREERPTF